MKFDFEKAVSRKDGLRLMCENWKPLPQRELISIYEAYGRVTAEDLYSVNTLPVVRSSCFDGVAVKAADFANGMPDTSEWVKGIDFVRADTGDDFPDEYDTIIAVEDVEFAGENGLRFREGFVFDGAKNYNPSGKTVKAGDLLVRAHTRITPEIMAALATGGITSIPVFKKPRVAFLPTGSELVPAGIQPRRGQNIDANSIMVKELLKDWGADAFCYPIKSDNKGALMDELNEAIREFDMVIINGGSSRGEEDFCSTLLQERGSYFTHGVRAVPGRPVGMSVVDGKAVVNVPGPVLAAYQAAHWLVSGLIAHYYGIPAPHGATVKATLTAPIKKRKGPFEMLTRVCLERGENGIIARPLAKKDGMMIALRESNGLLAIPPESDGYEAGDTVTVELLNRWADIF